MHKRGSCGISDRRMVSHYHKIVHHTPVEFVLWMFLHNDGIGLSIEFWDNSYDFNEIMMRMKWMQRIWTEKFVELLIIFICLINKSHWDFHHYHYHNQQTFVRPWTASNFSKCTAIFVCSSCCPSHVWVLQLKAKQITSLSQSFFC